MALENILIIIIGVATAGHMAGLDNSGIHRPTDPAVLECINEVKNEFEYGVEPIEDLEHQISDCHFDIQGLD
jgi:hypothetical protein